MGATYPTTVRLSVEEVDRASIAQLEAELAGALRAHTGEGPLIVDLGGVRFLDSSGIRALLDADRAAGENGGRVNLVGATGVVRRALEVSGVWEHLGAVPSA